MISLEEIKSPANEIIAIIIKNDFKTNGKSFLSKEDFPLQLGISKYVKGEKIKPHLHLERDIKIKNIQEVVFIKEGDAKVNLYDSDKKFFKSLRLSTGDFIFFVSGGHGFELLEDTVIVEVKQGPYFGKEQDKVMIE